ncbi:MAG: sulfurtransferase TusA family protein [Myxococcales bacterium]|nr:sulfurtransferase TusA family protein [Myxococcales bacterium]
MNIELDCKGLNCPMPIVKISKAIRGMEPGETLRVEANDPAFKADVHAWIRRMGHALVDFTQDGKVQTAIIRKR